MDTNILTDHWIEWETETIDRWMQRHSDLLVDTLWKKKKLGKLKSLADFWVFSTYFLGNFSTFCCINLKQEVEKTQKSAEAGYLKILSLPNFFLFLQWDRQADRMIDGRTDTKDC